MIIMVRRINSPKHVNYIFDQNKILSVGMFDKKYTKFQYIYRVERNLLQI
jgi:hypothetical protein